MTPTVTAHLVLSNPTHVSDLAETSCCRVCNDPFEGELDVSGFTPSRCLQCRRQVRRRILEARIRAARLALFEVGV